MKNFQTPSVFDYLENVFGNMACCVSSQQLSCRFPSLHMPVLASCCDDDKLINFSYFHALRCYRWQIVVVLFSLDAGATLNAVTCQRDAIRLVGVVMVHQVAVTAAHRHHRLRPLHLMTTYALLYLLGSAHIYRI